MVSYIMKVYIPFWFKVKTETSIKDGARHIHYFIKLTRYLEKKYQSIINPVIARNAYFAHPENVLLSMISDSRRNIRQEAIEKIVQARRDNSDNTEIRLFRVPDINFQANDYTDMVDLSSVSSPPVLSNISSDELLQCLDNEKWEFFNYPNHTQAVERTVKLVTDVSSRVSGQQNRDGVIGATLKSRKILPKNDNKKHLQNMVTLMDIDEN